MVLSLLLLLLLSTSLRDDSMPVLRIWEPRLTFSTLKHFLSSGLPFLWLYFFADSIFVDFVLTICHDVFCCALFLLFGVASCEDATGLFRILSFFACTSLFLERPFKSNDFLFSSSSSAVVLLLGNFDWSLCIVVDLQLQLSFFTFLDFWFSRHVLENLDHFCPRIGMRAICRLFPPA